MELPTAVSIREVGPRDGLQNEPPVPADGKVALIDALSRTGLRRIEAVSFVHPKAIPQMADADEVWRRITRAPDVAYTALVPNLTGARRAVEHGISDVEVVVSASNTHNQRNVGRGTEESIADLEEIAALVHAEGGRCEVVVSTAWGCPYEGDLPDGRVVEVARKAIAAGAERLTYGDTTGMATPPRVERLVSETREAMPEVPLGLHFHNTRGTGLANVLTALRLGVTDFDASVGGLGGCPYAPGASGNISTEELVHMLEDCGVSTGVDLEALLTVAADAEALVGHELPSQVLRAGPRTRLTEVS